MIPLYDNGAEVVADALWTDAGLVEGGPDEVGLLAVGEGWQGDLLSSGLPALRGMVPEWIPKSLTGDNLHIFRGLYKITTFIDSYFLSTLAKILGILSHVNP